MGGPLSGLTVVESQGRGPVPFGAMVLDARGMVHSVGRHEHLLRAGAHLAEAPGHPHLAQRGTFTEIDGVVQPAPAPRFHGGT